MAFLLAAYQWFSAHQVVAGIVLTSVLDIVIAIAPAMAGNSFVHQLLLWAQGLAQKMAPAAIAGK